MPQPPADSDSAQFPKDDQELYLVMGGEVKDTRSTLFVDPESLDLVGVFGSYAAAFDRWRGKAQATVDNAFIKYVIVRLR